MYVPVLFSVRLEPTGAHWKPDVPADASSDPLMVGGHKVYGLRMDPPSGYRNDTTSGGVAIDDEPETIYGVFNGTHYNNKCCFDYGNAETNNLDDGAGTMEALYFGNAKDNGLNHGGAGKGPWIMADMENALWGADVVKSNEPLIDHPFVTAMIKGDSSPAVPATKDSNYTIGVDHGGEDMKPCGFAGCHLEHNATHLDCENICKNTAGCVGYVFADVSCSDTAVCWTKSSWSKGTPHACRNSRLLYEVPGHWAIKGGNSQGGDLTVYFDGKRAPGYAPMKKQGAIILGIGGDNSEGAVGTFYEGAMTKGYTTDEVDDAIQKNIVDAGYGR